jgi:DNA-directed RNA polymerase subunit RPC12/RpoP
MDPFHFACPHCSSRLRVREKLFVGRHVDCPECGDTLLIVDRAGELGVERVERQAAPTPAFPGGGKGGPKEGKGLRTKGTKAVATGPASPPSPDRLPAGAVPKSRPDRTVKNGLRKVVSGRRPSLIVLLAAGGGVAVLLAAIFSPRTPGPTPATDGFPAGIAGEKPLPFAPRGAGDGQPAASPPGPRDDLETRLSKIGAALLEQVAEERAFPAGTFPAPRLPPESRLSWMAMLADRLDDDAAPAPLWNRPWNDPQNGAFVRRRLTTFQNPAIDQLSGADGYPAAHFVGVAGVGADAATLADRDPRAGIFGNDRRTRLEDIRDGASNTLLVMGVREHLGSWAAGGAPTVRGLAREPYVNGPDGFGTGSPDSMAVLMADGRVLTVNRQIDPRILRRMAAKSDGLPLDDSVAGEPADRPFLPVVDETDSGEGFNTPDAELAADEQPIDPEFAPEPALAPARRIDLADSLKQPITGFDQPRSKPLAEVLVSVAEMAGARITVDRDELGPAAARLAEPVALHLENTTVGDILRGLLQPAGLAYRIEGDHLRVVRAE